jgi:glycosyltransferase involved in cell wall biosynthesis
MRVLMVTPSYFPIKGGAESIIRTLSINLNHAGIQTDVMTFNMNSKWRPYWHGQMENVDGINVLKVPGLNWLPTVHSDRITQGVNLIPGQFINYLNRYDIIHFHIGDLTFPLFSYVAKKPKIAQVHGPLNFYEKSLLSRFVLLKTADRYIAISRDMQKDFVRIGVQPDKIDYLPNSVDTSIFFPSGLKEENLVLFVGRVTFSKGLHVLLAALRKIKSKIHLVIIGPHNYDIKYFQEVQNQIAAENKKGIHVITYLGAQNQACIASWCQKASIFVLPSFREASSVASLEALSSGTSVIVSDLGGAISEIVRHGENGLLVPPNDVIKLANTIQYLLDNESIRKRFGLCGRIMVLQNYSLEKAVERLQKIYHKFI